MNEHKMAAPKDAKPDEIRWTRASAGVVYVWKGDDWQATIKPEHAEEFVALLKQKQAAHS